MVDVIEVSVFLLLILLLPGKVFDSTGGDGWFLVAVTVELLVVVVNLMKSFSSVPQARGS